MTGVVTDKVGQPIMGICVHGIGGLPFPATNSSGAFSAKVRPGHYVVFFAPGCGTSVNWVAQRFTDSKFPYKDEVVMVRAGQTTTVNASLTLGGEITGSVTGPGGKLLTGVCVQLLLNNRHYKPSPQLNDTFLITNGQPFALTSVVPGRYRIQFSTTTCGNSGNYANQLWHNALHLSAATVVTVSRGLVVPGIDQTLPTGAVITGRVTAPGGAPVAGVCVNLFEPGWEPGVGFMVMTRSNGRYRVQALTTGRYSVFFDPTCDGSTKTTFKIQNYPHKVPVTDGKVTSGINATLSTTG